MVTPNPKKPKKTRSNNKITAFAKKQKIKTELNSKKNTEKIKLNQIKNKDRNARKKAIQDARTISKLNKRPTGKVEVKNSEKDLIIEMKNVTKVYASRANTFRAINGANLKIKKGEIIAILGPSGSGKTTLLNMISGLDRPTYGEIVVNNKNIAALSNRDLTNFRRLNVGFIFQSYNLLPSLNVQDNIEIGQSLQPDNHKRLNIKDILKTIGMKDQEKKRIYELSGGQQQRVSIARALSKNPDILIGDEPTGALDIETSNSVLELFKSINKNYKTTVIIVTHSQKVAKIASTVINVLDGQISVIKNTRAGVQENLFYNAKII